MLNFIIKHKTIILILVLLSLLLGLSVSYRDMKSVLEKREAYISAVENNASGKAVELEMTKAQWRASKDSVNMLLDSLVKAKGYAKTIVRVERVVSEFHKTDSITLIDTVFVRGAKFDTVLYGNDNYYRCEITGEYPNKLTVSPWVTSDLTLYTHTEKEFVNPRSKFFFIRWFQKKRKIYVTDVNDQNPYIEIKSKRVIQVVE